MTKERRLKLSELPDDTMLIVNEQVVMDVADFKTDYSNCKDAQLETAKKIVINFDVANWIDWMADDVEYECWAEDILDSLGEENIKLINDLMNKASAERPLYLPDEDVEYDL